MSEPVFTVFYPPVLICGLIIMIGNYMGFALAVYNRKWPPFKSKQLSNIGVALLSATMWWISSIVSSIFVSQVGVFAVCDFWLIWGLEPFNKRAGNSWAILVSCSSVDENVSALLYHLQSNGCDWLALLWYSAVAILSIRDFRHHQLITPRPIHID